MDKLLISGTNNMLFGAVPEYIYVCWGGFAWANGLVVTLDSFPTGTYNCALTFLELESYPIVASINYTHTQSTLQTTYSLGTTTSIPSHSLALSSLSQSVSCPARRTSFVSSAPRDPPPLTLQLDTLELSGGYSAPLISWVRADESPIPPRRAALPPLRPGPSLTRVRETCLSVQHEA